MIEGDSLNIINCLKQGAPPSWSINNFIVDIISFCGEFEEIYISHPYREVNVMADWLANYGVSSTKMWGEDEVLPIDLSTLIINDRH